MKNQSVAVFVAIATGLIVCGLVLGEEFSVKLTAQAPQGVPCKGAPACCGVPLPAGVFKPDQPFAVFAEGGRTEIPAQVLPLVVDPDGFLRWVLVDVQTHLATGRSKELTLKAAAPTAKPPVPLKLTDDAAAVTIDTGKVKLVIARDKPFSLFAAADAGGAPVLAGGQVSYTDATDPSAEPKRYLADRPTSVTVEYSGPMRATVCIRGGFVGDEQTRMGYAARVTAWAGRSDVHVKYSLCNSNSEHYTWRRIKESTIRLKLAAPAAGTLVGTSKPAPAGGEAAIEQRLRVVTAAAHHSDLLGGASWLSRTPGASGPGGAVATAAGKQLWASSGNDDPAEGWIAAKTAGATVFADDLYFVEDPPRRLAVENGELVLSGVVPPVEGPNSPFPDTYRWLYDCSHLSSQYVLDLAAPADADELSARARADRARPLLLAPPSWYLQTGAVDVGRFGTQADELACYKRWGWTYDPARVPARPAINIPRWSGGDDNHFTSEQDTTEVLALMYLRTGQRAFYDAAESWANYFMDLQTWRTDGWRWKDGGVWWVGRGSPIGSAPQRAADPVVGMRTRVLIGNDAMKAGPHTVRDETVDLKVDLSGGAGRDMYFLSEAKACHCHDWGQGLATWFLITGDRDALDAAIDDVEQVYQTQLTFAKARGGKLEHFSRDFTRACEVANAVRMCRPADSVLVEASDRLAAFFLDRPVREPRGFVNGPSGIDMGTLKAIVGTKGLDKMKELGVSLDEKTGEFVDARTGARWLPLLDQHTWMFPPLSRAMDSYVRLTGNEDARDWVIAYGQAVAHVLYQTKHGCLAYDHWLGDFPVKGFAWDSASWRLPDDSTDGAGVVISGFQAQQYPDVPARAYALCGEPFLKQRAFDFWKYSSHRGYQAKALSDLGKVDSWVNCYSTHAETVSCTGTTYYVWSHERRDDSPPAAITDLKVLRSGDKATVSFTAPADAGGGKVARYQVKCADKPLVSYQDFLLAWKANTDSKVANWWMATNVAGESSASRAGQEESFVVTGVPAGAKYFAIRSFDDSGNRSEISNVAQAQE